MFLCMEIVEKHTDISKKALIYAFVYVFCGNQYIKAYMSIQ